MHSTVSRRMRGWLVAEDGRWRGPNRLWALLRGRFWLARGWSAARSPDPDLPVAEAALRRAVHGLLRADAEPELAQALLVQVLVERGVAPEQAVREVARDACDPLELEALWLIPIATALRDVGVHRALPLARGMLADDALLALPRFRQATRWVLAANLAARRRSTAEAEAFLAEARALVDYDWAELGPTGLVALAVCRERLDHEPHSAVVDWLQLALDQAEVQGLWVAVSARRALARALARRGELAEAAHVGAGVAELALERAGWLVEVRDDAGALAVINGRVDAPASALFAAGALRRLGRSEEGLGVLESLGPDASPHPPTPGHTPLSLLLEGPARPPPCDLDLELAEERARCLVAAGRRDEALASLGLALHLARGRALHGADDGVLERLEALGFELVRP